MKKLEVFFETLNKEERGWIKEVLTEHEDEYVGLNESLLLSSFMHTVLGTLRADSEDTRDSQKALKLARRRMELAKAWREKGLQ